MLAALNRKNKINLPDYPYKKDISNRLFLAERSPYELEVLHELMFQPSKCRIQEVADAIGCDEDELILAVDAFSKVGLTMRQHDMLFIDKELRKYFEVHITKLQNNFEPSFEYIQTLLNKIPISVLPGWYSIPRSSDNIFASIIEKYLETPKIYQNYLAEVTFDEPILHKIVDEVYSSQELCVEAAQIRDRYSLSREKLEEYILLLEFHFVLGAGFKEGQEVLMPFSEWRDYLLFQKKNALKPVSEKLVTDIKPPVAIQTRQDQEQSLKIFRETIDSWHASWSEHIGSIEKSVFELERAMRGIPSNSWIPLHDFIDSLIAPIGLKPPVTLLRVGKKWRYNLPVFSAKEKAFIELVLFDLLYKVGITTTGLYDEAPCFMITPFGRVTLGDA